MTFLLQLTEQGNCDGDILSNDDLSADFKTSSYELRTYTSGCYFFNQETEEWDTEGMTVRGM